MSDDRYPMLAPGYLEHLEDLSTDEIRARRAACVQVETAVSFVRRMVQGRLDIVLAEQQRRGDGGPPVDVGERISQLPDILGEHGRPPGLGRLPQSLDPLEPDPELSRRVDGVISPGALATLGDLGDDELVAVVDQLRGLEQEVSSLRQQLFDRIDPLQSELTRRYQSGEETVDSLLDDRAH